MVNDDIRNLLLVVESLIRTGHNDRCIVLVAEITVQLKTEDFIQLITHYQCITNPARIICLYPLSVYRTVKVTNYTQPVIVMGRGR